MASLRLGRVELGSRANGPGVRDVFWVTGCGIGCKGCINPHFLVEEAGRKIELKSLEDLIARRASSIEGITFSGGEPTEQAPEVAHLAKFAHQLGLSVLLFTGRSLASCQRDSGCQSILQHCDLVVAGPYVESRWVKGTSLLGSSNQTIHFLSDRYSRQDLEQEAALEIRFDHSFVSVSGFRQQ